MGVLMLPSTAGATLRLHPQVRGKPHGPGARGASSKRMWAVQRRSSIGDGVAGGYENLDSAGLAAMQADKLAGLTDPVKLNVSTVSEVAVRDAGGDVDMSAYLKLPVEQYTSDVLAGGEIERLSGDVFLLTVPRLQLFDIWLRPAISVVVNPPDESESNNAIVRLTALDCTLQGSPVIENMGVNERIVVKMETTLEYKAETGTLEASADLKVWTEIIAPFDLLPRGFVVGTANAVIQTVMNAMLQLFVKKVALDYARWSSDEEFRVERKSVDYT